MQEEVDDEGLSIERRKKAAEIGAKSSSYKTRFAAMKLASGDEKEVRGSGNKAAKRAAKVSEAVYGGGQKKELPKPSQDDKKYMTVTAADKAGNTPAYQRYKAGDKRYKDADHMKESSFRKIQEKLNLKKDSMGDVIKDFYKSDAPQFKGRSKEKRREMAIAAKLTAERGPQNESATEVAMSPDELALQKRKTRIDKMITMKRQQALQKAEVKEATYPSDFINPDGSKRSVAKKKTGRPIQHINPRKRLLMSHQIWMKKDLKHDQSFKDRDEKRKVTRGGWSVRMM